MNKKTSSTNSQCIALAAIFQAAEIAHSIATGETPDPNCFQTSLNSVFILDAESTQDIYPNLSNLSMGFHLLEQYLQPKMEKTPALNHKLKYILGLISLQKKLVKSPKRIEQLQQNLLQCQKQLELKHNEYDSQILERLANVYVDTIGGLGFRIMVKGKANVLNMPGNAQRIRCSFLSGIRAAVLWYQIGGRQWHLILKRPSLRQALESIKH